MPVMVETPVTQCSLCCFVANYFGTHQPITLEDVTGSFAFVQEKIFIRETLYHVAIYILYKHDSREMCGYMNGIIITNIIRKAGVYGLANDINHLDKTSSQDTSNTD